VKNAPKKSASATEPQTADTRTRLLDAAAQEFNEKGFLGTDTNRIARRAGFAPQTFYRWFADKTEIFIAVYQTWEEIERQTLERLLARNATTKQLTEAIVAHHRDYKIFRRSLRQLSTDDATIRRARAASRKRQIAQLQAWRREFGGEAERPEDAALAAMLLQMERLADALAEQEFEDMDLSPAKAELVLAQLIDTLRAR
jgi:AcrR family transcriptional regulator